MKPDNGNLRKEVDAAINKLKINTMKKQREREINSFVLAVGLMEYKDLKKQYSQFKELKLDLKDYHQGEKMYKETFKKFDENLSELLDYFGPTLQVARNWYRDRAGLLKSCGAYDYVVEYFRAKFK